MMSNNSKRGIAKIKMAQKFLNMDDDTYRALLLRLTGKDSATNLTEAQQTTVLKEMERLGWKPIRTNQYKKPTSRKIAMLWKDLHQSNKVANKSRAALCSWIKSQTGKPHPDWLTPEEASTTIKKLKQWLNRPTGGQE